MPIDRTKISEKERDTILEMQESHFVDLKAIDIKPAKLSNTISAFANADGGELYIGIDENKVKNVRSWRGFTDQEAANGHLQAFETIFPLGRDFDYSFLVCAGEVGIVLQVTIRKTKDIKKATDGCAYIRRGAQNLAARTHEELKRLEFAKGIASYESEALNINLDLISESSAMLEFIKAIVPNTTPSPWLKKQQLIRDGRPTVAAALLFAEEPQALIPKHCGIKIYRYKTSEAEGARDTLAFVPKSVEGHLYLQIKIAVETTVAVIEEMKKLGERDLEAVSYPHETLHEIITNAVIHRDYSLADDIHIRIYDNRVEIESPGVLPAHITPNNILSERYARNGTIVRLINKFPDPPNKDVGEGLNTAFSAMRNLKLKDPIIEQKSYSVLVRIKHEPLASPEEIILSHLEGNESIKNKKAREITGIGSENKVKDVFKRLIKAGKIEKVPGTSFGNTLYRKKRS